MNIARYSYSTWFVIQVIELLVQGKKYYDSLYGEAEIVATAYTNFGNRSAAIRESTYSICIDWTSALKFPYIRLFMPRMAFLHHVTPLSCEAYQSIKTKSLWRAPNPENLNFISTSYVHEQYIVVVLLWLKDSNWFAKARDYFSTWLSYTYGPIWFS